MRRLLAAFTCLYSLAVLLDGSSALAESVTMQRIDQLPAAERAEWKKYLERSESNGQADAAALQAEVEAAGRTLALPTPDGGDFKLSVRSGDPWFASQEALELVSTVLSYQSPAGGWSKHVRYASGPRQPAMQWTSQSQPGKRPHYLATFDNRSTTEQLHFLANVWHATKREDCKAGFLKGLDYILAAQYPNGGWPQVYPLEGDYHDDITFNDDAMIHVLELLLPIVEEEPRFALVDEARRKKAAGALAQGIRCILDTQITQQGKKTAWCAQHDAVTLKPSQARAAEPPTLSGMESSHVVRFLMSIPEPSPEVAQCIEDGLAWLEHTKITGLKRAKRAGRSAWIPDPQSQEVFWARFYDVETSKPVFPGKNGKLYDTFEAMAAENVLGYDFYTSRPGSIVKNGQKKWRKMMQKQ